MLKYRKLGKCGLEVTEIGLGCWAIGGPSFGDDGSPNGWAGNDDKESLAALHKAYELGINHWDTADAYGKGHSEQLIGEAFKQGIPRDKIVLATKVGWFRGTARHPFEQRHVRNQLEQSLRNMHTDYVDIYYLHNPYFGENDEYLEGAAEEVHLMKTEGKIRVIGQSAYTIEQFKRVCPVSKPEVLQLPYNAMRSPFDTPETDIFKWADEQDLGVVMFGTYAKGLLTGKYDANKPPAFEHGDIRVSVELFQKEFLKKFEPALKKLRDRFGNDQQNLARIANQYALTKSVNAVAIPGFKNIAQVESNFRTMGQPISDDDIAYISETLAIFKQE
jgi:aryl-alcohol dehydrogenase-like predicted oxidoreductase